MSRLKSAVFLLFNVLFLASLFAVAPVAPAEAKRDYNACSAEGQKPCPAVYKGPRCDKGLGIFGGKCRKCGGEGMRACPKSAKGKQCFDKRMKIDGRCYAKCGGPNEKACNKAKRGYPCKGNYAPDSRGFCKPCGGPGQTACRALKAGKQCHSGTAKFGNKCERCGGLNQRACPTSKAGKRCNGNLANIDGTCQRCGGLNQKACPALKAGKQCGGGLTKIKGYCKQCGGPNQQACPKLASGYPCKGKYEPNQYNICKPCGGNGQKPCRALKAGKQCNSGLHKINKICQACGQRGQIACPKIYAGYPCKGKLEPDRNKICQPCGRANQKACRALKAGKRCERGTANIKGYCITCGGPEQPACPKLASGYPCRGKYEPNERGICKPCGGTGQTACRVLKAGRQCAPGSTERGGVCVSCGGEGQRACKITDKGKACADGLKRGLNGICKITPAGETKKRAMAELKNIQGDILPILKKSRSIGENDQVKGQIRAASSEDSEADPGALPPIDDDDETRNVCFGGKYGAITVGVGVEAGVIVHAEGEAGIAIRCGPHAKGQKDIKLYSSGSINVQLGAGGSGGVTVGLWKPEFNQLRGKSHGYVLDLSDAFATGKMIKTKSTEDFLKGAKKLGWDFALGMWFERLDEDGDGKENEVGSFQGFTISVSKAMDLDVGGVYVRATTVQKCDHDMKCTEGLWSDGDTIVHITRETLNGFHASVNDGPATRVHRDGNKHRVFKKASVGTFKFRKNFKQLNFDPADGSKVKLKQVTVPSAEGVWAGEIDEVAASIVIDEQFKDRTKVEGGRDIREEYLYAAVDGGARERFDRKGGRTWESSDGDTIKFRKNWTVLKYNRQGSGGKGDFAKSDIAPLPSVPSGLNVLGQWDFHVNRRTHTEEIISQTDDKIVVRRFDTELERTYNKVGDNIYAGEHEGGGTFRFVTDTRALWISGDQSTVFQLNKRAE